MQRYKIIILTSGKSRGSNFVAIVNHIKKRRLPIDIAGVIVTSKTAPIIDKCISSGIPYKYIKCHTISDYQADLFDFIQKHQVQLVVLAGFMKLLEEDFIQKLELPIINIHPALLPNYGGKGMYGINVHKRVFQDKRTFSGITIHLVNGEYDKGQIIFQKKVRIHRSKSPEILAHRVLRLEHKYYGPTIYKFLKEYYG